MDMTPLESARAELRDAAIVFSAWEESDDDNYVTAITRLEVAAKAFAEISHVLIMTEAQQWVLAEYQKSKTPPGNQSGEAS